MCSKSYIGVMWCVPRYTMWWCGPAWMTAGGTQCSVLQHSHSWIEHSVAASVARSFPREQQTELGQLLPVPSSFGLSCRPSQAASFSLWGIRLNPSCSQLGTVGRQESEQGQLVGSCCLYSGTVRPKSCLNVQLRGQPQLGTNKSIDREASLYKTKWTTTALVGQVKVSMAKMAIYGPLAIGPWAINSSKWGIPEKSYKNVAQQW